MPKKIETPDGGTSSSVAIKESAYSDLVGKVQNHQNKIDASTKTKSELIADAVEGNNLHAAAFRWVLKLRKLDPVKRNEMLFHFDVMCGYENFTREDLLSDRAAGTPEGEEDLRPRHLRQAGASAASTVQQLAANAGAKTSPPNDSKNPDDPINKIGRGPDHKLN